MTLHAAPSTPLRSAAGSDGRDRDGGRPEARASGAVRGAVRRLRREHARQAVPVQPRAALVAEAPALATWLARTSAPESAGTVHDGTVHDGAGADGTLPDALVGLLGTLRAVTTRYVCRMRGAGARPEQMLVRVKACVREAMDAEGWYDPEAVQVLTAAVVTWSIAAYYDR